MNRLCKNELNVAGYIGPLVVKRFAEERKVAIGQLSYMVELKELKHRFFYHKQMYRVVVRWVNGNRH
jgi:hypothetical protein